MPVGFDCGFHGQTAMDRLTISDIDSLRATSEPLSNVVAAYTSSDSFKSRHPRSKSKNKSLSHHFSAESCSFFGSALKKSANRIFKRRLIPLGTGRPTAAFYPWDSIKFQIGSIRQRAKTSNIAEDGAIEKVGSVSTIVRREGGTYDLSRALNYGHGAGSQPLLRFVTEHVEIVHNPPYQNWGTCLSCGSTSALEIALRIFCNRGDTVLTERYTYPGMIEVARLIGVHALGVDTDAEGLVPDHLARILRTWDVESQGHRPKILYTIPSGQNPTGATQSLERKKAIYQVVEEYDLIIIEDDPYYFLRTELWSKPKIEHCTNADRDELLSGVTAYLASLPPSFLALDRSGRVVRLDSTSKILAPGLRAGWVTASDEIIDKFISYHEVSTVAVSGPTQLMLWNLLDATWGHVGFFSWLNQLSLQYRARLLILLKACDRYLPRDVAQWVPPQNGMFLWISLDLQKHSAISQHSGQKNKDAIDMITNQAREIEARILSRALDNGVQITKGSLFDTVETPSTSSALALHFRLTYAAAEEWELEEGIKIFANAVRAEFSLDTIC